ncbi:MAG: alpha-amylase family glycosyl hydrolase, partial [Chloroflexi bacterium]|nr:alpha-amylase family glycosyl hydrolase [Chloroflexota bacterium]
MTRSPQPPTDRLGASPMGGGRWRFLVWAPNAKESVTLLLDGPGSGSISMDTVDRGYWLKEVSALDPTSTYRFRIDDGQPRPDPASHHQPSGVHGPSQLVDTSRFSWGDSGWHNHPLERYITYELHVGTFTPEGTFDAAIQHLDYLVDLGITAVELMPVSQFPIARNWGYDGVLPFAVQDTYGGPAGLQRLVDACHRKNVAVILDVVYNHFGPEGNQLPKFGPYFTDRYKTPWGSALNFDGPQSDEVRRYFIENALYWVTDFHIDALRLDA